MVEHSTVNRRVVGSSPTGGVATSIRQIQYEAQNGKFTSVQDIASAVNSAAENAQTLFFGLIEAKVGNKPLKNDLDIRYSSWAETELDRKMLPIKNFVQEQRNKQDLLLKDQVTINIKEKL